MISILFEKRTKVWRKSEILRNRELAKNLGDRKLHDNIQKKFERMYKSKLNQWPKKNTAEGQSHRRKLSALGNAGERLYYRK